MDMLCAVGLLTYHQTFSSDASVSQSVKTDAILGTLSTIAKVFQRSAPERANLQPAPTMTF